MENKKKKIFKKWWFWLIIVFIIFSIIGSNNNDNNTIQNDTATINNNDNTSNIEVSENTTINEVNNNTNIVENNTNINNIEDLKPSNENYKKYVYEVFDAYYKKDYNFSGDKSDWNIVNQEGAELYRTKLEGKAHIEDQWYKFYIILEFTDNTYSEYVVKDFKIGNETIYENK